MNKKNFKFIVQKLRKNPKDLAIHDLEYNIFLFVFGNKLDKKRVLSISLYIILGYHLILKD